MEEILLMKNLKKYFGSVRAVDGIDLSIRKGEFVSIIGPNGAGKTTLVNLISGLLLPDEGQVIFNGMEVSKLEYHKRVKIGIARSFQLPRIYNNLTVFENIAVSVLTKMNKNKKMLSLIRRDSDVVSKTMELLELFEFSEVKNVKAKFLPYGAQKMLDVAIAFALEPKLLILDEPTSGSSTRDKKQIMERICSISRDKKLTLIVVEHDMDVIQQYSDRVVVLENGKKIAEGRPEDVVEMYIKEVGEHVFGSS